MEPASLTLAHDHARAASVATHAVDTTVAINEHALAAGEFAKAASGTGSVEALRTLRLLEQHHQRLSELLRYPIDNPPTTSAEPEVTAAAEKRLSTSAAVAELRASKSDLGVRSSSPLRGPPGLNHPARTPHRDLSSSIASNLASARGIRTNHTRRPLSPSVSNQQAPGSLEALPRKDGNRRSHIQPSIPEHPQPSWLPPRSRPEAKANLSRPSPSVGTQAVPSDGGFSRFYSAFENILSKVSAPLAFAGLPLVLDETQKSLDKPSRQTHTQPGSDPDLSKYISRAALRASSGGSSGNDSFYVVPTTGHTVSYAHILSFAEKEKRRLANSMHSEDPGLFADPDDDDDFVDARESPMPASPSASRTSLGRRTTSNNKDQKNKVEELTVENQTLKDVVDQLTRRLSAFELQAQNSSMALQESMRLIRDISPARERSSLSRATSGLSDAGDELLKKRIADLEDHVRLGRKEAEKLGRENEKLKEVLAKYRDRWERLKEGAKTRRTDAKDVPTKAEKDGRDKPNMGEQIPESPAL